MSSALGVPGSETFFVATTTPMHLGRRLQRLIADRHEPPPLTFMPDWGEMVRLDGPGGQPAAASDRVLVLQELVNPPRGANATAKGWRRPVAAWAWGSLRAACEVERDPATGAVTAEVVGAYRPARPVSNDDLPVPLEKEPPQEVWILRILTLRALALGGGRCEVTITRYQPALRRFVDELLQAFRERWPEAATAETPRSLAPVELPTRPADQIAWRETWRVIRSRVNREDAKKLNVSLKANHPRLPHDPKTIRRIIAAGRAGLLTG